MAIDWFDNINLLEVNDVKKNIKSTILKQILYGKTSVY